MKVENITDNACFVVTMDKLSQFMVLPIDDIPWECAPFTREDVLDAVEKQQFNTEYEYLEDDVQSHVQRIAYFYAFGWSDPVLIDVGCPSLGYINYNPVIDGNHRLYAASLRQDKTVLCFIEGEIDYAIEELV